MGGHRRIVASHPLAQGGQHALTAIRNVDPVGAAIAGVPAALDAIAPVAVSAFSAEQLARRNIQSTQDLDRITPSLQFATSGQLSGNNSAAVVFIRGLPAARRLREARL